MEKKQPRLTQTISEFCQEDAVTTACTITNVVNEQSSQTSMSWQKIEKQGTICERVLPWTKGDFLFFSLYKKIAKAAAMQWRVEGAVRYLIHFPLITNSCLNQVKINTMFIRKKIWLVVARNLFSSSIRRGF